MEAKPVIDARLVWPADKKLPKSYDSQKRTPCPKCLRLYDDDFYRAVLVISRSRALAYFRCRCCGHRFKLYVKQQKGQ